MTGFKVIEQLGMGFARGFALKIVLITHLDGRRGVVVGHTSVLDKHARNTVAGSCHNVTVIKTEVA